MNNNMIARHAFLTAGIERTLALGGRPPQQYVQELHSIEARAQATMTPMEQQQAMQASQSMQAQYIQQQDMRGVMKDADEKGYYTEQLSKDLTGMTPDQLEHAKRGQPIPVQGRKNPPLKDNLRQMLKNEGLGDIPYEKFVKVADRVEEMKGSGKDYSSYLNQHFGKRAQAANSLIGAFHMSGIGLEVGLRGEPEKDHYVQPTDELVRRTNIADAWARKATMDKDDHKAIITDIDPAYIAEENDTIQGDIARAMMASEREEQANDRANYTVPSYNIEETDDEMGAVSGF